MSRDREPLSHEEYEEALASYIEEYRNNHLDERTFRIRLYSIGVDRDEIDYYVRVTVRS